MIEQRRLYDYRSCPCCVAEKLGFCALSVPRPAPRAGHILRGGAAVEQRQVRGQPGGAAAGRQRRRVQWRPRRAAVDERQVRRQPRRAAGAGASAGSDRAHRETSGPRTLGDNARPSHSLAALVGLLGGLRWPSERQVARGLASWRAPTVGSGVSRPGAMSGRHPCNCRSDGGRVGAHYSWRRTACMVEVGGSSLFGGHASRWGTYRGGGTSGSTSQFLWAKLQSEWHALATVFVLAQLRSRISRNLARLPIWGRLDKLLANLLTACAIPTRRCWLARGELDRLRALMGKGAAISAKLGRL